MAFRRIWPDTTSAVDPLEVNMPRRILAVLAVLALAVPALAEGPRTSSPAPKTIKVELSGYSVDLNLAGTPMPSKVVRGLNLLQGHSRPLGPVTATSVAATFAAAPAWPLPEWCTGDVVFLPLIGSGYLGLRFHEGGELLEAKSVPDADPASAPWGLCWNYKEPTHPFTARLTGLVIAGSGRFHDAEGTTELHFKGYCADPPDCGLSPMLMNATIKLEK
jgi:hypothetical protein